MTVPGLIRAAALRIPGVRRRYDGVRSLVEQFEVLQQEHALQAAAHSEDVERLRRELDQASAAAREKASSSPVNPAQILCALAQPGSAGGKAYGVPLPEHVPPGDTSEEPRRSRLQVLEDGVPLGPAHALHSDIADKGDGLYSHWKDSLVFSASDGSDPRTNGRAYHVLLAPARAEVAASAGPAARLLRPISDFAEARGHMFTLRLPAGVPPGDTEEEPTRSRLQVFENGVPVGPAHTPHADIAEQGKGRYSHWEDGLMLSASDNSDPRTNEREYHVLVPPASKNTATASDQGKILYLLAYFEAQDGHAYSTRLPKGLPPGDANEDPGRSPLQILENGLPLGPAHAMHSAVAEEGRGRYSHWGHSLKFSTSDNSDPRTNGREYHILVSDHPSGTMNMRREHVGEGEIEALKLQIYFLRSDFNRSVARVGELQAELRQAAQQLRTAQAKAEDADRRCGELEADLARRPAAPHEAAAGQPDRDQAYARLLGAVSSISADLGSLRRSLAVDGSARPARAVEPIE